MHLGYDVHRCVVFVGYRDPASPTGFKATGSGFLVTRGGAGYLVTARHVAAPLAGSPFAVRVNRKERAEILDGDDVEWIFHPDVSVDLAATPFHLGAESGFDVLYQPTALFVPDQWISDRGVSSGDVCYTVGLFKYLHGDSKNLPVVHTGHIALLPPVGEKIPVWNKEKKTRDMVEGYLIESHAIDGASGSPVMFRRAITIRDVLLKDESRADLTVVEARVHVLGLFSGAWFFPPDDAVKETINASRSTIVPVGIGIVVPARKIIELLETGPLDNFRKDHEAKRAAMQTAAPSESEPPTTEDNPTHREDFRRLLDAAAKTRPQGDET